MTKHAPLQTRRLLLTVNTLLASAWLESTNRVAQLLQQQQQVAQALPVAAAVAVRLGEGGTGDLDERNASLAADGLEALRQSCCQLPGPSDASDHAGGNVAAAAGETPQAADEEGPGGDRKSVDVEQVDGSPLSCSRRGCNAPVAADSRFRMCITCRRKAREYQATAVLRRTSKATASAAAAVRGSRGAATAPVPSPPAGPHRGGGRTRGLSPVESESPSTGLPGYYAYHDGEPAAASGSAQDHDAADADLAPASAAAGPRKSHTFKAATTPAPSPVPPQPERPEQPETPALAGLDVPSNRAAAEADAANMSTARTSGRSAGRRWPRCDTESDPSYSDARATAAASPSPPPPAPAITSQAQADAAAAAADRAAFGRHGRVVKPPARYDPDVQATMPQMGHRSSGSGGPGDSGR